ncbi:hypothetical protein ACFLRB_00365 [Acidobacteriota bacterium]
MFKKRFNPLTIVFLGVLCFALSSITGCKKGNVNELDLSPFIEMARNASCADISNRLFVIDDSLVLHDRAGNCPDNSYGVRLFRDTPDQVLCKFNDSIGGPVKIIDNEAYRQMFETIINNLDQADLGLGANHTVEEVSF